ncbi:Caudovirales tail fibre assembly protein [Serratia rubidaea]|uniref:Caudovirales tail fibre assembly protein n=1 Tax=Serratia rubidaea TaxID=61652 RepID=A0A4U9HJ43_SERRU|nr:tail fiber assembly protein [Serratia rubidaea]QPR62557.1 tail fiber assembly protein [Serratia rubidaea]CAI0830230.1 Caudovirales tail fibre assembly protein [Serratia rubidaea]CAI1636757.1 Caudovirales tail fibre assembly protein [Serratia rubidaea]VTP62179.1 Caudovirales tail fibre assembly protein [Serratia rubidaea]HAY0635958.1 tail fiber assembly protein [Serratia rubidaea]
MSTDFEFSAQPRWMWIYNFDENNVFTGTLNFYVAPHTGLPANCTTTKCAPKTGQAGVWNDGQWQYVNDYRGSPYWDAQANKHIMFEVGPLPDGCTFTPPKTPYDTWDGEKWVTDEAKALSDQIQMAKNELAQRSAEAAEAIAPLQDAVEFGDATDAEQTALTEWKKYRLALSRIDVNQAPDISWPTRPTPIKQ